MASTARKKINLTEMHNALIALGHEKLWFCWPVPKGRKLGVCKIVTWDNYVVAEKHQDVLTKGWDFTKKASAIFPCPSGSEPWQFDEELCDESLFMLSMIY